jgi:hypothetical protein
MTEFVRSSIVGVHGYVPHDRGSRMLSASAPQGTTKAARSDWERFDTEVRMLRSALPTAGASIADDHRIQKLFYQHIEALALDLRQAVSNGALTWKDAAEQVRTARHDVRAALTRRTSPFGLASGSSKPGESKSFNALVAEKLIELHGTTATFQSISEVQRQSTFAAVTEAAGKANTRLNASIGKARSSGRALILMSIAASVYDIAVADSKMSAARKQSGAGAASAAPENMVAGLNCAAGATPCVSLGLFASGTLAGHGLDPVW